MIVLIQKSLYFLFFFQKYHRYIVYSFEAMKIKFYRQKAKLIFLYFIKAKTYTAD